MILTLSASCMGGLALAATAPAKAPAKTAAKAPAYSIQGKYYETCACAVSCPCAPNRTLPTEGHCDAVSLINIQHGMVGATRLDGINLAVVLRSPQGQKTEDAMIKGEMDHFVVYLDDKATPQQREALGKVMPALFGTQEIKGAQPPQWVPMSLSVSGDVARFDIAGGSKLAFEIENIVVGDVSKLGAAGPGPSHRITLSNTAPFPWVSDITQGISKSFTYDDLGQKWSYESRNAFFGKVAAKGTLTAAN
jgi:hypothetical protein